MEAMTRTCVHDKLSSPVADYRTLCNTRPSAAVLNTISPACIPLHHDPHPERAEKLVHLVMVPYPLQGHLNPMMQFAKALVVKHPYIRVTFVNNRYNHERIQQTRTKAGTAHVLSCEEDNPQLLWIEDGLPSDFVLTDVVTRIQEFLASIENMKRPFKQLLQSLHEDQAHPVSCVVFGSFCPWVSPICAELGIPSVFFWTQSASVLSIYYHTPLLAANRFFPYEKEDRAECADNIHGSTSNANIAKVVSYIPGVPPLCPSSLPTLLHVDSLSEPIFEIILDQLAIIPDCQGIIIHSFEELEEDAYQALQAELPFPVSLVGPLLPPAFLEGGDKADASIGSSLMQERSECMDWLDTQKPQSVLYVSFGSIVNPTAEDIKSIACGIKESKQPFLWVLRPASSIENVADLLPEDFMDDTKDSGLIIPWAPQLQVLSHPSVGAFLTHCGWNSTLEGVSMGVPLISLPFFSDQPTNAAYICDVWKVGMTVKRQGDGKVRSAEVERVVRTVLGDEKGGEEMRERAQKLKEAARQAMRPHGSSSIHMERFIHSLIEGDDAS